MNASQWRANMLQRFNDLILDIKRVANELDQDRRPYEIEKLRAAIASANVLQMDMILASDAVDALARSCPLPIIGDDGTVAGCVAKGHCGCNSHPMSVERFQSRFQLRVMPWMQACFGPDVSGDRVERNHRFLEESLELVQAMGCTRGEAMSLVNYVYDRPDGEPHQEVGGVMVTLAALCLAAGLDMHEAGWDELSRIWSKIDQIRAKQAAKPKHSPLPGPATEQTK